MVKELHKNDFTEIINEIKRSDSEPLKRNMIIEFYISTCPHCLAMEPVFEELSDEFKEVDFFKTEITGEHDIAKLFNIEATPTFMFFSENDKPVEILGEIHKDKLREKIRKVFDI